MSDPKNYRWARINLPTQIVINESQLDQIKQFEQAYYEYKGSSGLRSYERRALRDRCDQKMKPVIRAIMGEIALHILTAEDLEFCEAKHDND